VIEPNAIVHTASASATAFVLAPASATAFVLAPTKIVAGGWTWTDTLQNPILSVK
jgi:hypothetical protein